MPLRVSLLPNFVLLILMIYLKLQLVRTRENVIFGRENKVETENNTKIYLNSSFLNPPFECGLVMDIPCNSPRLAFKNVLQPMINNEILLNWKDLIANKLKITFNVNIYLLDDFDKNLFENCGLNLLFRKEFTQVSNNVAIQLEFKSYGNETFTYKCSNRNAILFTYDDSHTNLISTTNFHKISLQSLTAEMSFVAGSKLSNIGITSQKLHIYNSTLISCIFHVKQARGIIIDESHLEGISGSINTVTNVKILNSNILHGDDNTHAIWTILNVDHLLMVNLEFIDRNPSKSILKLSSIQRTDIIDTKFVSKKGVEPVNTKFLIYAEMILNINIDSCKVQNLGRGWISLKYTSDVSITKTIILGNVAQTRILFVERVNEFCMDECEASNNVGGVLQILDASNSKIANSTFTNNLISNDNGGSIFIDAESFISVDSVFNYNTAVNGSGGAIAASDTTMVSIDNSLFNSNSATRSGGAVAMLYFSSNSAQPRSHITNSVFTNNRIKPSANVDNFCKGFYYCEGSGGAISLKNILTFRNVNATKNYAIWGGAVFTISDDRNTPSNIETKSLIESNYAEIAGGGVFTISGHFFETNIRNNSAGFYGNNIASSIKHVYAIQTTYFGLDGKYLLAVNNSATLNLFLGQYAYIEILKSADYFGNLVTILREDIQPIPSSSTPKCVYTSIDKGINISFSEITPQPKERSTFIMYLNITSMSVPIRVVISQCPHGYSLQEGVCGPSFPMEVLISSSVVGVLLALISGIIIGLLITFGCKKLWKIKDRLNKLRKLEKAEEDIEKRLLKSELHKNYGINYDVSSSLVTRRKKPMKFLINSDDLKIEKKIGEGAFGAIFLAKCWETTNVAIKSFHQKSEENGTNEEEFEKEVSLLVNLRNPFIVTMYGVCITESQRFMVVEYCERGSLEKIINDCRNGKDFLTLPQKIQILLDISAGMKYLHGLKPKLIHRDLKPANVLINAAGQAKVCDFGLSKIVSTNSMKQSIFTKNVGTFFFMAPETFEDTVLGESIENRDVLTAIDVFSFSMILYELFFEENLYLNEDSKKIHFFSNGNSSKLGLNNSHGLNIIFKVAKEGLRPLIPFENRSELSQWADVYIFNNYSHLSDEQMKHMLDGVEMLISLMVKCWSHLPSSRPNFSEIFNQLKTIKKLVQ